MEQFQQEKLRLSDTLKYLEQTISGVYNKRIRFNDELKDAYLNLDAGDSSASYATIMFNTSMLDHLEDHFDQLIHARAKPYFARIDVTHPDQGLKQALYLGKISLFDDQMAYPLVVDWRAPVASLYYDGRLGKSQYEVEGQLIEVDLSLKRQYTIEKGQLVNYLDVDISTSDAFLQAALNQHATDKLKDIVSTIQAEQNAIIRADIHRPLIVQGVAGSGKTTIALHRIAYLIYTYAKSFKPQDFMIIAPNSLFLDYISSVLPELGAEKVCQTTYEDLMFGWLGKRYSLSPHFEKLIMQVEASLDAPYIQRRVLCSAYKNSMACKTLLDNYLTQLETLLMPRGNFMLDNLQVMSEKALQDLYFGNYAYLPLFKRIEALQRYMKLAIKALAKESIASIEDKVGSRIEGILTRVPPSEERRTKVVDLMSRREERIKTLKLKAKTAVKDYFKDLPAADVYKFYLGLISDANTLISLGLEADIALALSDNAKGIMSQKRLEVEDLAPMVYLKKALLGIDDAQMKYVVIDEAQDFGLFQFFTLKQVLNTDRFTILGDMAQGIHAYRALENWESLNEAVLSSIKPSGEKLNATYLTLEQSYRTTIEIMMAANSVIMHSPLRNMTLARPVVRQGQKPRAYLHESENHLIQSLLDQINALKHADFTTMALITRTDVEAKWLYKKLKQLDGHLYDVAVVDEHAQHFDHPILVLPAYLSKGLEFDAVMIINKATFDIDSILETKLLYVAMTRAMHRLSIHGLSKIGLHPGLKDYFVLD